jgi:hypothetical protein
MRMACGAGVFRPSPDEPWMNRIGGSTEAQLNASYGPSRRWQPISLESIIHHFSILPFTTGSIIRSTITPLTCLSLLPSLSAVDGLRSRPNLTLNLKLHIQHSFELKGTAANILQLQRHR